MLTTYLESLIHKGEARFRTFVCGQSGSNLLPKRPNSWIIITGFTYINFADPVRAVGTVLNFQDYIARSLHQIRFKSSKSDNHYVVKDDIRRDVGASGSDINQIVNGDFANGANNWILGTGWFIVGASAGHIGPSGAGNLTNIGFTTIPGRRYRLTWEIIAGTGGHSVQPFLGNVAGFSRSTIGLFSEEIVAGPNVGGQLEFRAPVAGAGDDVTIDNIELILLPEPDVTIVTGHYKIDCYLPHQNEVTVEFVGFPITTSVIQTSAASPASFPLSDPPAGYGNAGLGGIAQVSEFSYDVGGFGTFNLPLTRIHTDPLIGGGDIIQNGMEIPVSILTAINEVADGNTGGDIGPRNFPIVNIQYVEIGGNMPDNIQGSN